MVYAPCNRFLWLSSVYTFLDRQRSYRCNLDRWKHTTELWASCQSNDTHCEDGLHFDTPGCFPFHSDTDHILATEIHEIGSVNYIHAAGYDKLQA